MILLAGGLVTMEALGVERHEVGMGLEKLDEEESAAMVRRSGGEQSEWQHMVTERMQQAMDLVLKVSGGEGEASAYLGWLEQRTRNLIRSPGFWPSVEAVAHALEQKGQLSGQRAREMIKNRAVRRKI